MIEFIRHSLGLCGEGHINLITFMMMGWMSILGFLPFIKNPFKKKEEVKN